MRKSLTRYIGTSLLIAALATITCIISCSDDIVAVQAVKLPEQIDFNFHVKPILADRCYKCHGPDEKTRKAGLRFDTQEGLFGKTNDGQRLVVAGKPHKSAIFKHIISSDPEQLMPPPESNLSLNAQEKALIERWIKQGAVWKDHWAFLPLTKPQLPEIDTKGWGNNPIDQFVFARLVQEGIAPSPKADSERLLRRVYMDLTGLPPSIAAIERFLAKPDAQNLELIIDELMQTDAFAERLTMDWLDVARYADSHGYHADGWRSMYPWRDWVIGAFKKNMPYDEFCKWQLAGDLLPNRTEEQLLATAFNRNHQITAEGGAIDEEYRLEYVFDRVNTTATAFLGMTMKCAQCHDHKFDPITQKEFYQFSAFFNNVDELGMNSDDGNAGPTMLLLEDSSKLVLMDIQKRISSVLTEMKSTTESVAQSKAFIQQLDQAKPESLDKTQAHVRFERLGSTKNAWGYMVKTADNNFKATFGGEPKLKDGKIGKAVCFDDEYESLFLEGVGLFERNQPFSAGAWINPEAGKGLKTIFCNSGDKNSLWRGWDFLIDTTGQLNFRLIHALPHDQAKIQSQEKVRFHEWQHVLVTYDGSGRASGMNIFLNGIRCNTQTLYDQLNRSMLPVSPNYEPEPRPLRIGKWNEGFSGEIAFLKGCFDDVRVYDRQLSALEVNALANNQTLQATIAQQPKVADLLEHYLLHAHPTYQQLSNTLRQLSGEATFLQEQAVEVQIMDEDRVRPAFVLERGVYTEKREQVVPTTPSSMGAFPTDLPKNRLGLATWMFSKDNPLTARVTVNRYWQLCFGKGIVATPHDFGNQGALPSHPELLDWLATSFIEHNWDLRWLLKTIVTSATYQQSSLPRADLNDIDPQNILLARGPAFRLPAEMIRDNALAASGLLVRKVGGEPVKPYQPDNIWGEKSFFSPKYLVYHQDTGANLYRRSMYTILKRTSPHPAMITMDGNDRSYCLVQRPTTNTPLQALVLLNDPTYLEAARVLAERMKKEGGVTVSEQISFAFRHLTGRRPNLQEVQLLSELYEKEKSRFLAAPEITKQFLAVGEYPLDPSLPLAEVAALAVVNNTIINHDESYMRR
ncbi:MAG: DUF1553 domain-containing protein [Saprospiraceae bacterium]|nr:DUF1553 domain-containing protein [Saprospiraceae bacterium]